MSVPTSRLQRCRTAVGVSLAELRDEMLSEKPLQGEDKDLILWQVLLHVVNHGTDLEAVGDGYIAVTPLPNGDVGGVKLGISGVDPAGDPESGGLRI